MLVAVVLGNRMNDDGTITAAMEYRLKLALEVYNQLAPQKLILSGGVANVTAGKSEAQSMFEWLSAHGVPQENLVLEDNSLTTKQNAQYSVPILQQLGAKKVVLITSPEHMARWYLNPIKLFKRRLKKFPNIQLLPCCKTEEIQKCK